MKNLKLKSNFFFNCIYVHYQKINKYKQKHRWKNSNRISTRKNHKNILSIFKNIHLTFNNPKNRSRTRNQTRNQNSFWVQIYYFMQVKGGKHAPCINFLYKKKFIEKTLVFVVEISLNQ
jgi:hypothetical protein